MSRLTGRKTHCSRHLEMLGYVKGCWWLQLHTNGVHICFRQEVEHHTFEWLPLQCLCSRVVVAENNNCAWIIIAPRIPWAWGWWRLDTPSHRRAWSVGGAHGWTAGHRTDRGAVGVGRGLSDSTVAPRLLTSVGVKINGQIRTGPAVMNSAVSINRTLTPTSQHFTWWCSRLMRDFSSLIISTSLGNAGWWCFFETLFSHSKWCSYSFSSACSWERVGFS